MEHTKYLTFGECTGSYTFAFTSPTIVIVESYSHMSIVGSVVVLTLTIVISVITIVIIILVCVLQVDLLCVIIRTFTCYLLVNFVSNI